MNWLNEIRIAIAAIADRVANKALACDGVNLITAVVAAWALIALVVIFLW